MTSSDNITKPVTCIQSSSGYEVSCCMESEVLQRTVQVKYLLDPCNYAMSIILENIEFVVQLLGYEWGKIELKMALA